MTTMTATATYRKTKTGEWVAYGTTRNIAVGSIVITKANGTTERATVTRLGTPFVTGGREMVYGYLAPRAGSARITRGGNYHRGNNRSYGCEDCQWVEDCGDARGCSAHRGDPRN